MGIVIIVLASISAFIQANVGFGFNTMFMAMGPHFLPYSVAQVLCFSGAMMGNVTNILPRIKRVNFRQVLAPIISYSVATFISIEFSKGIDMDLLRRILGVLLFILAIYFIVLNGKIRIRPSLKNGIIAGLLSGVGGGLFAITGPPVVVYYLSALKDKEEYMATVQTFFFLSAISTLSLKLITGTFGSCSPMWLLFLLIGVAIGNFIGVKTYSKLNVDKVRLCVYIFMALSGIWIFISG
ncbi:MAG: sulfite exporter TauE/SafE family protein [Firmicutes bacterium]|nr:sulfite exporter TauE/SafE family protein [Bacillota bacterium]